MTLLVFGRVFVIYCDRCSRIILSLFFPRSGLCHSSISTSSVQCCEEWRNAFPNRQLGNQLVSYTVISRCQKQKLFHQRSTVGGRKRREEIKTYNTLPKTSVINLMIISFEPD